MTEEYKLQRTLNKVWGQMLGRCYKATHSSYKDYGGRGISVCREWIYNSEAFCAWAVSHGYAKGLQIDRIDNSGDYSPENCRWVSSRVNTRNRRNTVSVTAFGETKPLAEWCEDSRCRVQYMTLAFRIRAGWDPERALTESANESTLVMTEAFGETKSLRDWSRDSRCVVPYKTLHRRIAVQGYPPELAITTPLIDKTIQSAYGKGNTRLITAFGESKSIEEWSRDSRCTVASPGLWLRLFKQGLDPETAITRPNRRGPKDS